MEEEEAIGAAVRGMLRVEMVDGRARGRENLGVAGQRLGRGVEEVAINAEVVEGRARPLYVHSSEAQLSGNAS